MKNNKLIGGIIAAVVVVVVAIVGFLKVQDRMQISKLNEEINKINSTANIDQEIKTTGKYAEVEKGVKDYLTEYQNTVKELNDIYSSDEYKNLLSTTNYEADKPEFKSSIELINKVRTTQDNTKNKLTEMIKSENISKKADDLGLTGKYKTTFTDIIKIENEANKIIKTIESDADIINQVEELINILKDNPTKWSIKGNQVQFTDSSLLSKYNSLIVKLNSASLTRK